MKTTAAKNHPRYTDADYTYLREKGYSDEEIIAIWERDEALGRPIVHQHPIFPDIVGYLSR